jgi:hypothetical protein
MKKERTTLTLHLPNGQRETLNLDACLFGGIIGDGTGFPCGGYHGNLDMDNTMVSMIHIMRAYLKICDEQGLNSEAGKMSLEYCLNEAVNRESKKDPKDNVDLTTHMLKFNPNKFN